MSKIVTLTPCGEHSLYINPPLARAASTQAPKGWHGSPSYCETLISQIPIPGALSWASIFRGTCSDLLPIASVWCLASDGSRKLAHPETKTCSSRDYNLLPPFLNHTPGTRTCSMSASCLPPEALKAPPLAPPSEGQPYARDYAPPPEGWLQGCL